ncbi:MAG TPA: hypothetical protein VL202_04030 [Pararhizobium sp.]|uniref:hypothetical protein n=1 Tax=Pararhizobium sp. TaxID=1977563 RepID=UPI002C79E7D9|nr:hypothetical protein [Pararhizobium sp.]HTO30338.1 hypothetical protein [Pararhizobium sp.]
MRAFTLLNATKVSITTLALVVSLTGFADARDRHGDRNQNHNRRPHHQQHRDRSETLSGVTVGHRHHDSDRHGGKNRLVGRTDYHHREQRFAHNRRPNRRIILREYRGDNRNDWEPAYREGTGGAYLGGLSAWRDPGNGTYFSSERYGYDYGYQPYEDNSGYPDHRAKIIHVNPSSAGRACSWESGVCVIRR